MVHADLMTVDVVLADDAGITTADASVEMTISGSTLTIYLRNLLSGGPVGAGGLLSGLAFDMPDNYEILGGSVAVGTDSFIRGGVLNGSGAGTSVSGEWGYGNAVSGHFNGLAVDSQVSAMEADSSTKFSNTSIENPVVLNGPEFGLLGTGEDRGGLTAIEDRVVITLNLNHSPNGGFLNSIQGGIVAVTYGSPTGSRVPDASSTLMLLGIAMLGIEGMRRRVSR
jgi:hypothetical protein